LGSLLIAQESESRLVLISDRLNRVIMGVFSFCFSVIFVNCMDSFGDFFCYPYSPCYEYHRITEWFGLEGTTITVLAL